MLTNLIHWLNEEPAAITLQRENAFAMLTWRDLNQPADKAFTGLLNFQTAAWLFILAAGIPVLMLP